MCRWTYKGVHDHVQLAAMLICHLAKELPWKCLFSWSVPVHWKWVCAHACVSLCEWVCVCVWHGDDEGVGDSRIFARGSRQMWETWIKTVLLANFKRRLLQCWSLFAFHSSVIRSCFGQQLTLLPCLSSRGLELSKQQDGCFSKSLS